MSYSPLTKNILIFKKLCKNLPSFIQVHCITKNIIFIQVHKQQKGPNRKIIKSFVLRRNTICTRSWHYSSCVKLITSSVCRQDWAETEHWARWVHRCVESWAWGCYIYPHREIKPQGWSTIHAGPRIKLYHRPTKSEYNLIWHNL